MISILHFFQRHVWLALLLLTTLLYVPGTRALPLMDRDEPRFAHATVEMMQQGSWVVPYFNADPRESDADRIRELQDGHKSAMEVGFRFDKPPLTYWWMRLHYALFGIHELAARLHSITAVWLVAWVIFQICSKVAGRRGAWLGAFGWLTSLQILVHGRICVADMPMILTVTVGLWAILEITRERTTPLARFSRWWWLLWLSLGAGFLAKGPIALAVPLLAVLLWRCVLWRRPVAWGQWQLGWGILLMLLVLAAWGIPALVQTQGWFWRIGMGEHVVQRGAKALNGRQALPFYYFISVFLSLMPWIAFLPQMVNHVRRHWDARTALLVSWFVAPALIFTPYATQLPHYIMPGFPAFFALLAGLLNEPEGLKLGRWSWVYLGLIFLLGLAVLALTWGYLSFAPSAFRAVLTSLGLLLACLALLGGCAGLHKRWGVALATAGVIGTLAPVGGWLRQMHPVIQMGALLQDVPPKGKMLAWEFTEPSLIFYSNHHWTMLSKLSTLQERFNKGQADVVVLLRREWSLSNWLKHWRDPHPLAPSKDLSAKVDEFIVPPQGYTINDTVGYNLARSTWTELRIIRRAPSAAPAPKAAQ